MNVVCPNASCSAQYDIDPSQIPSGKKGFKCAQCGGFVPIDTEALGSASDSSGDAAANADTPKSLIIILTVALLMIVGGAGFFYYQLQIINQGGLLMEGQAVHISHERMMELKEKVRQQKLEDSQEKEKAEVPKAAPEAPTAAPPAPASGKI